MNSVMDGLRNKNKVIDKINSITEFSLGFHRLISIIKSSLLLQNPYKCLSDLSYPLAICVAIAIHSSVEKLLLCYSTGKLSGVPLCLVSVLHAVHARTSIMIVGGHHNHCHTVVVAPATH